MNLELVETATLLTELFRRFDHAVFAGMKVGQERDDGTSAQHEHMERIGNARCCQGLACGLIDKIERQRERYVMKDDMGHGDGMINCNEDDDGKESDCGER